MQNQVIQNKNYIDKKGSDKTLLTVEEEE